MAEKEKTKGKNTGKLLHVLSTIPGSVLSRLGFASKMGSQYGGDRDIFQALGYPSSVTYADCFRQYLRQDIAKAIIDRPVNKTWAGPVTIEESTDDEDTALEKAWVALEKELQLKARFARLDKLTGLGRYGVLLLGFNDIKTRSDWEKPVTKGNALKLVYVKPLGELGAPILKWEADTTNPRFGSPLTYDIQLTAPTGTGTDQVKVHYSRVLHVIDGALESETFGIPRLDPVYNRLQDLMKIVGGSAEMYWRGARPGIDAKVDEGFELSDTAEDDLEDQFDEYENNLRRLLISKGMTLKSLATQVSDPSKHVDVQLQMISAETSIPKRILTGSERGELSSAQDASEWSAYIQSRREEFVTPQILRAFIDIMIELGVLPPVANEEAGYTIGWEDLFAISEKDKAEIGKIRATATKDYAQNPMASAIVPPAAFRKFYLGFSDEDNDLIEEMLDAYEIEELEQIEEDRIAEEEANRALPNETIVEETEE